MNMRNFNYTMMTIIVMMMSIILFSSCKKSFAELNAEHEAKRSAIEKKLTKKYCYDVTKIALGQKFSRIDTIIITKYSTQANNAGKWDEVSYPSAYVRTDGKVKGKINNQEGIFTYWFETNIETDNIDKKIFNIGSMYAEDKDGYHVVYKYGIFDYDTVRLNKMNSELKAHREFAKKMEQTINGIKVRFVKESDLGGVTGIYYDSDKKLSDAQMKIVAKNVKIYYDYVEFCVKGKSYAYYDKDGDYVSHDLR